MFKRELKYRVRIHTDAKPYLCRHRADCFAWPDKLKTHLLKSHNEGTWFMCHVCQKKFCHDSNFKTVLFRYEAVKPYVCNECPKCFYTATELSHHHPVHSEYKQFSCGLRDQLFKHKERVKRHFKKCSVKLGVTGVLL